MGAGTSIETAVAALLDEGSVMNKILSKRALTASLLGLTAFGAVFGSAASLGGLSSDTLGAGASVVASCDTDGVGVTYTRAYDSSGTPGYKVTAVTVTGVADTCDGQTLSVTLTDSGNSAVGAGSTTIPTSAATSHAVTVTPQSLVSAVVNAHVVIAP
jgi:hypothetical protein